MDLAMYLGFGFTVFLGVYLPFEYWDRVIFGRMIRIRDQIVAVNKEMFVIKTAQQVMTEQIILCSILTALIFILTWPQALVSVILSFAAWWWGWTLPLLYLEKSVRPARIKLFSEQMVDALTLMSNGLKSGLNVSQTLQIVVDEMPKPISQEFALVLSENKVGLTLEQAFDNLAKRIPGEDVTMFVTSVNILRETGGNIAETFATIVETIRQRMKLQNKIGAMVAQGFISAIIVTAMPWGLGATLYIMDPEFMGPLFKTVPGWGILMIILFLQAIGFLAILKIIKIRV